jgi:hypothetical protein
MIYEFVIGFVVAAIVPVIFCIVHDWWWKRDMRKHDLWTQIHCRDVED